MGLKTTGGHQSHKASASTRVLRCRARRGTPPHQVPPAAAQCGAHWPWGWGARGALCHRPHLPRQGLTRAARPWRWKRRRSSRTSGGSTRRCAGDRGVSPNALRTLCRGQPPALTALPPLPDHPPQPGGLPPQPGAAAHDGAPPGPPGRPAAPRLPPPPARGRLDALPALATFCPRARLAPARSPQLPQLPLRQPAGQALPGPQPLGARRRRQPRHAPVGGRRGAVPAAGGHPRPGPPPAPGLTAPLAAAPLRPLLPRLLGRGVAPLAPAAPLQLRQLPLTPRAPGRRRGGPRRGGPSPTAPLCPPRCPGHRLRPRPGQRLRTRQPEPARGCRRGAALAPTRPGPARDFDTVLYSSPTGSFLQPGRDRQPPREPPGTPPGPAAGPAPGPGLAPWDGAGQRCPPGTRGAGSEARRGSSCVCVSGGVPGGHGSRRPAPRR